MFVHVSSRSRLSKDHWFIIRSGGHNLKQNSKYVDPPS
jgi:hypothetical protein